MSRLFISHSSKDNVAAIAFKQWLVSIGWEKEDIFLDLDDIGAGEKWKEALRLGHSRCEAVIFLASPEALASLECNVELRKAEDFGKEIIVVLLHDLTHEDPRLLSYRDRQIVDLSATPLQHEEKVDFRGQTFLIQFNETALAKIRDYLRRRGVMPESFAWPPQNRPDAEPYPGMAAFSEEEAAIFFGRDADILRGLEDIRQLRRRGSPRLFVIQAASGSGKSSFLRAGLWPRLARDPDFAPIGILRPAQGLISGPQGLAALLAKAASTLKTRVNPGEIAAALLQPDAAKAREACNEWARKAVALAWDERRVADAEAPAPALIFAVDQAEELLTPNAGEENGRFLDLLGSLTRAPPGDVEPLCLLTLRSDSAPKLVAALTERGFEPPRFFALLPLAPSSYHDVIVKPVELMSRRGGRLVVEPALVDRLVADSTGADALPLLAFTLLRLYQGFSAGQALSLEQYEAMGGVSGALREAVQSALARPDDAPAIPADEKGKLDCLHAVFVPALAQIDETTGQALRRVARMSDFEGSARAMVERLVKVRLLLLNAEKEEVVVEVAHESVLRNWAPLAGWLELDSDDLRAAGALERATAEWSRSGRKPAWLDHRGDRLAAAERLAADEKYRRRFGAAGLAYIAACRSRESRRKWVAQGVAAAFLAIVAIASFAAFEQQRAKVTALALRQVADSKLELWAGNIFGAVSAARGAMALAPSEFMRSALFDAAARLSPNLHRSVATIEDAANPATAVAWLTGTKALLATSGRDAPAARLLDGGLLAAASPLPKITRSIDGNQARVVLLAPVPGVGALALYDEGALVLLDPAGKVLRQQSASENISLPPFQSAAAASANGKTIVFAATDGVVWINRCDWSRPQTQPACSAAPLGNARGQAVAIRSDASQIAVGGRDGTLALFDAEGRPGLSHDGFGPVFSLAYGDSATLFMGGNKGGVARVNLGDDNLTVVGRSRFGAKPVVALAATPQGKDVVFVCGAAALCLMPHVGDGDEAPPAVIGRHEAAIARLAFSPDGASLLSASPDGAVRLWSLEQDKRINFRLDSFLRANLVNIAVSPDRQRIAGGGDRALVLWDASSGARRFASANPAGVDVADLGWSRDGRLAVLYSDQTLEILSPGRSSGKTSIALSFDAKHLAWSEDGATIFLTAGSRGVMALDPRAPETAPQSFGQWAEGNVPKDAPPGAAWGVATLPGGRVAVSYTGGTIRLFDAAKRLERVLPPPERGERRAQIGVGSMSVSADGALLAAGFEFGWAAVYDLANPAKPPQILDTGSQGSGEVAFDPTGKILAVLNAENRLTLWRREGDSFKRELVYTVPVAEHDEGEDAQGQVQVQSGWISWLDETRIAVAGGAAAVLTVEPRDWAARLDELAIKPARQ